MRAVSHAVSNQLFFIFIPLFQHHHKESHTEEESSNANAYCYCITRIRAVIVGVGLLRIGIACTAVVTACCDSACRAIGQVCFISCRKVACRDEHVPVASALPSYIV